MLVKLLALCEACCTTVCEEASNCCSVYFDDCISEINYVSEHVAGMCVCVCVCVRACVCVCVCMRTCMHASMDKHIYHNYGCYIIIFIIYNGLFIKHGLKLNLEKTEVLHIGHQREELDIELEGNILNQRDSFVYLGGAVCGDGKTEREVRRRVQAGANANRAVEGVMADRRISND